MLDKSLGEPRDVFPFFVGFGRSGTTLLRAMFDSHPELAVPNEASFIVRLSKERRRYETEEGFNTSEFINDLSHVLTIRPWDLSVDEVREALSTGAIDYADAIRRVYGFYALREGKPRYGNKTPAFLLQLPLLGQLFPEAKFIHLIRDGRDVALSHLDIEGWGPQSLGAAATEWGRQIRKGRSSGAVLGSQRYREVRYESLLEDPERALTDLCGWLGLEYDDAMLRYYERAAKVAGDTPHFQNIYRPPTKGLRNWREQMNVHDVVRFEALAGDVLDELGYERANHGSASRVRSWWWRGDVVRRLIRTKFTLWWRRRRKKGRWHADQPSSSQNVHL